MNTDNRAKVCLYLWLLNLVSKTLLIGLKVDKICNFPITVIPCHKHPDDCRRITWEGSTRLPRQPILVPFCFLQYSAHNKIFNSIIFLKFQTSEQHCIWNGLNVFLTTYQPIFIPMPRFTNQSLNLSHRQIKDWNEVWFNIDNPSILF